MYLIHCITSQGRIRANIYKYKLGVSSRHGLISCVAFHAIHYDGCKMEKCPLFLPLEVWCSKQECSYSIVVIVRNYIRILHEESWPGAVNHFGDRLVMVKIISYIKSLVLLLLLLLKALIRRVAVGMGMGWEWES